MEIGTVEYLNAAKDLCSELFPDRKFPNTGKVPIFFGRREKILAEGRFGIVDYDTDNLFSIASDEYKLVRHEEIVKQVHDACLAVPEYGIPELGISLPYSGAKMKLTVNFPEMMREVNVGDEVIPTIVFRSSYDLQWKVRGDGGVFRKICSNGAMIPVKGKQFNYINRHISTLDLDSAINAMKETLIAFSEQNEIWKKWAETQIGQEVYDEIWDALPFSPNEKEKIEALPEAGTQILLPATLEREELTLWGFHNVVSQYVTHNIESEMRKADVEPHVAKTFNNIYLNRMTVH
jgi:hypothetical protein